MQHTADTIVDVQRVTRCGDSGGIAEQFDDQAFRGTAFQTEAAKGMEVWHVNRVFQHVNDIRIVQNDFGGQRFATQQHTVDAAAGLGHTGSAGEAVTPYKWPLIVKEVPHHVDGARRTTRVLGQPVIEGVGVDTDGRTVVVTDHVVQDHRLRAADVDRRRRVIQPAKTIARRRTTCSGVIHFDDAVADPHVGLLDFDGVESGKIAFQRDHAAGVCDQGMVNTARSGMSEVQTAPVALVSQRGERFAAAQGIVVVGVKRAARTIAIV